MQMKAIASVVFGTVLACTAGQVLAQKVYRVVGPDGRVTFSDRAPSADAPSQKVGTVSTSSAADSGPNLASLPLEVKQAATKYPVTLYTTKDCSACDTARDFLKGRGIPFAEKSVTSNDEIKALTKLNGDGTIPLATLGGQQLKGFNQNDWDSYLNAANYPVKSQLPASYTQAAATPLIPKVIKPAPAAASAAAPANDASAPSTGGVAPQRVTPTNPTGITF